jgi:four helix bundle suffix protein
VARTSLEELKLDYEDFLRQNKMQQWERNHPMRQKLVDSRLQSADEVAEWVRRQSEVVLESGSGSESESGQSKCSELSKLSEQSRGCAPNHGKTGTLFTLYAELSANAALTLTTVAGYLLDRHLQSLAHSFQEEGGFSERLYRVRSQYRREQTNLK